MNSPVKNIKSWLPEHFKNVDFKIIHGKVANELISFKKSRVFNHHGVIWTEFYFTTTTRAWLTQLLQK